MFEFFIVLYACHNGNKGISSKDGYTFIGRGMIQITGRAAYKTVEDNWIKEDLTDSNNNVLVKKNFKPLSNTSDRDLISNQPAYAVLSALVYWRYSDKKLNDLSKDVSTSTVSDITKQINGSITTATERKEKTDQVYNVIKNWFK